MKFKKLGLVALAATTIFGLASCTVSNTGENTGDDTNQNGGNNGGNTNVDTNATYTLNYATTTLPSKWNPHTYETATDDIILSYSSAGFYTFDYNETKDGYKIVADMAKGEPVDVTSQYVGEQWGIEADATSRAWKITLRDDLKWDDGTPIKAEDFVTSAKLLLNPLAQNHRADSLYEGNLVIKNSKEYLYQGKHAYSTAMVSAEYNDEEYVNPADFIEDENGVLWTKDEEGNKQYDMCVKLSSGGNWGSNGIDDYANAGYFKEGKPLAAFAAQYDRLKAAEDKDKGLTVLNKSLLHDLQDIIAGLHGKTSVENYAEEAGDYAYMEFEEMCFYGSDYPATDFDTVGVKAEGNDLILILEKPLSGFYLLYSLTSSWLVKEDLYKSCEQVKDGVYTNTYGTSVATSASYGPYKLTEFILDKQFKMEKNPNFFGYNDKSDVTTYQTTAIVYTKVADSATSLQMFEKGLTDSYGLTADDMKDYGDSDYLYYTEGASTFFIALNPKLDGLQAAQETRTSAAGKEINKTILTLVEFRKALSFAVNRKDFCLACDPTGMPAKAIFNNLIISDPETGTAYRTLESSKDIVIDFWGLTDSVGEGNRYENKDDAIESITGVDLTQAREYFQAAYDKAISEGLMTPDATIELCIGQPSTANFYVKGYDYLVKCWTNAVKGTDLEGKLTFTKDDTIGNGFSNALKGNKVDVLFGVGWTGAALDPYSLVSAYTDPKYQYDPAIDYSKENISITFDSITDKNGTEYKNITLTTDALKWSREILSGTPCDVTVSNYAADPELKAITIACGTDYDNALRCKILNAVEALVLRQYTLLPLDDEASSSLKSMKINFYTEQYVYGVGRGGVKYTTFNYSDEEWAKFVAEEGGILNYK